MSREAARETGETTGDMAGETSGGRAGGGSPTPMPKLTICPYCGARSRGLTACENCRGRFDPLSRQATQNAMGPWYIRDDSSPHRPGCSYETLVRLVARGSVTAETVIRGPSSRQFWTLARWCPGVAHLLGVCHSCQRAADPVASACESCGASFRVAGDRQVLGLGQVRFVPGREEPEGGQFSGPSGAGGPVAAAAGAPVRAQVAAGAVAEAPVDPRVVRLERELRAARRWRAAWCVAACLLVLGVAGVLVGRRLDLGDGPMGRWLGGSSGGAGSGEVVDRAGASASITPPRVDRAARAGVDAAPAGELPAPASGVGDVPAGGSAPLGEGPAGAPEADEAGGGARLESLGRLRRLR